MDETIKAKWIEALRSGKYPQGKNKLKRDGKFCCLGVLCDIVDPSGWRAESTIDKSSLHMGTGAFPGEAVHLASKLDNGKALELASMNDNGQSFAEIADYIEAEL